MPLGKIKEDKTKMDKVKNMIVKLISRALSMEEFEAWLYYDEYIKSRILDDEDILELLSINLKSKYARAELKKYLYAKFGEVDCLIEQIKVNCELLVSSDLLQEDFESFLQNLSGLHDWGKNYSLLNWRALNHIWQKLTTKWYIKFHGLLGKSCKVVPFWY